MSSFPQPFISTVSHWQATNQGPDSLYNHGKSTKLPSSADIVIVGGGLTGASLAYHLTQPDGAGASKTILVLEAKDIASGATGRNGGHVRPASFTGYPELIKPLTEEGAGLSPHEAVEILEDEESNMRYLEDLVRKEKLNAGDLGGVQWARRQSMIVCTESLQVEFVKEALFSYQAARKDCCLPEQMGIRLVDDPQEARRITRVPTAVACISTEAGIVHPHKLATAFLRLALAAKGGKCNVHSWTPVYSIRQHGSTWIVQTNRGVVQTKQVVLATNAHTKHLWNTTAIPFGRLITPARAHACHITLPSAFCGSAAPRHSLIFDGGGTYFRDAAGDGLVMGCGATTLLENHLATPEEIYGMVDDSYVIPAVRHYLESILSELYDGWVETAPGEGTRLIWSGIMGYSRDQLPFIGPVPGEDGLFAAVAFHGHGMSRIFTCTRALAEQMKHHTRPDGTSWIPRAFQITNERISRALSAPPVSGSYASNPEPKSGPCFQTPSFSRIANSVRLWLRNLFTCVATDEPGLEETADKI